MTEHTTFELVEDPLLTTSGFELRVNVAKYTSLRDGEISLTAGCSSMGEFQTQIERLVLELSNLLLQAEERFSREPYGPGPLDLK